jgi:PmbA protein
MLKMIDQRHAALYTAIETALTEAKRLGVSAVSASASEGAGLSASVRLGEIDTIEQQRDRRMNLTIYVDGRKGSAASSDFSNNAIRDACVAARDIARHAGQDRFAGLAEPQYLAQDLPDLDLCHPWQLDTQKAVELATAAETTARQYDSRITNSDGASVNTYTGHFAYGNSHGFLGGWSSSRHSIDCTVIASDAHTMQRDYWYSITRDARDLEASEAIGRKAAKRALKRLGARPPKTCSVPVIFEQRVATTLFSHLLGAISGGAQYRKASFLLDQIDQRVFAEHVNLSEQPHLAKGLGSAPFDSDGVATNAHEIVSGGILRSYALSAYAARKLNLPPTGNGGGIHNLIVVSGNLNLAQLIAEMHEGLLVTELMGFGVNNVTGDYSRGASGFWVSGGEIQYPIEEATIAGNLKDMFRNIIAIGNDIELRGNIRTGSMMIAEMTVAGH